MKIPPNFRNFAEKSRKTTMEIIMVRHTSVDVPKGTCYGWTDVPVAKSFETEAAITKENLTKILASRSPEAVFSSPLSRARLLAKFCGFSQPVIDERLKELNMGDWEMQRYDDISDPYIQEWYEDYLHLPTPNGESFPMQCQRVGAFLDEQKARGYQRILLFAHGGVLGAAAIHAGLYTPEEAWKHLVPYGGILTVDL